MRTANGKKRRMTITRTIKRSPARGVQGYASQKIGLKTAGNRGEFSCVCDIGDLCYSPMALTHVTLLHRNYYNEVCRAVTPLGHVRTNVRTGGRSLYTLRGYNKYISDMLLEVYKVSGSEGGQDVEHKCQRTGKKIPTK